MPLWFVCVWEQTLMTVCPSDPRVLDYIDHLLKESKYLRHDWTFDIVGKLKTIDSLIPCHKTFQIYWGFCLLLLLGGIWNPVYQQYHVSCNVIWFPGGGSAVHKHKKNTIDPFDSNSDSGLEEQDLADVFAAPISSCFLKSGKNGVCELDK